MNNSDTRPLDDRLPDLTIGQQIQRDEGFKKLAKEGIKPDVVEFKDHPTFGPQHLHVGGKPCPFKIEPAPGAMVLLRKIKPDRTDTGIFLPESHQPPNSNRFAIVVKMGEGWTNEHGARMEAPAVKVGDEVVVSKSFMVEPDGEKWPMLVLPFDCYLGTVKRA